MTDDEAQQLGESLERTIAAAIDEGAKATGADLEDVALFALGAAAEVFAQVTGCLPGATLAEIDGHMLGRELGEAVH